MSVDVSVVIPTFQRPDYLRRVLASLAEQQAAFPFEVVVVDNDPEESAAAVVAQMATAFPVRLRRVSEPRTGQSQARNTGFREAEGDVVALLDDDVVPRAGWLTAITAPIRAGAAAGTGGPVILDPNAPSPQWFRESGLDGYLTAFTLGSEARPLAPDEILVTANAAFDRASVHRVGGFPLWLGRGKGSQLVSEDVHLVRALGRAGEVLRWCPEAVVEHAVPAERLKPSWLIRRAWSQGRSDWLLAREDHPGRRFGGARVAVLRARQWFGHEWRERRRQGVLRPGPALHAVCDVSRVAGMLSEAARGAIAERPTRHTGRPSGSRTD